MVLLLVGLLTAIPGWAVADILYTNAGTPTGLEEEIRWRVNRGRFDTVSENQTRGTSYTDVPATAGPLAPNQALTLAARHQSEDMAKNNVFQHATVTGSAYYNPVTQPQPWDRMTAEGYSWSNAGENIAAGYSDAESAYVGWWNSTGHRENMYNAAFREIGNGYYYWAASTYGRYYTMDLGSSGKNAFFTDTLFRDANANGVYDSGEGIGAVVVRLTVGSLGQSTYGISSEVGSFAVPLQSITSGAVVSVVLSNTAATNVTLTLPRDYSTFTSFSLASHQERVFGTFVEPSGTANVGLRNVTPQSASIMSSQLTVVKASQSFMLSWSSQTGLQYLPQWSHDAENWSNLIQTPEAGTGGTMSLLDGAPTADRRFYRLVITGP